MTDRKKKKGFLLYTDYRQHISGLSDQEAGQLFKAVLAFADGEPVPELTPCAKMAFSFISAQITRDTEKWEDICHKRKEAVMKRWEKHRSANDTNVYNSIICNTNDSDSDNDNEYENDYVNDKVNENGYDNENDNGVNRGEEPLGHAEGYKPIGKLDGISPDFQETIYKIDEFFAGLDEKYKK